MISRYLERFFNDSISNIGKVNGNKIVLTGPYWGASGFPVAPLLNIVIQDGKVTGIWCMCTGVGDGFYWTVEQVLSRKAKNFYEQSEKKIGFNANDIVLPWIDE